jgi:putative addiction module component (TIGR02574 family)
MSTDTQEILVRALALPDTDKAHLVDELLTSLTPPDDQIDALWREEVEDRIAAYNAGELRAVPLDEVLAKYRK